MPAISAISAVGMPQNGESYVPWVKTWMRLNHLGDGHQSARDTHTHMYKYIYILYMIIYVYIRII
jgi:hypothetical protein